MAGLEELGRSVRVKLDEYLAALEVFTNKSRVEALKTELGDYGINGEVTVYGAKEGDGEVVMQYEHAGVKGLLRFNTSGSIYEGWKAKATVGHVSSDLATYFIGGLFGAREVPKVANEGEVIFQRALLSSKGCWEAGNFYGCDKDKLSAAKIKGDRVMAEKEEKTDFEEAKKQKQRDMLASMGKIEEALGTSERMLKWAVDNDHWYNNIKPDEIRVIIRKYEHLKNVDSQDVDNANYYAVEARKMLVDLTSVHTGVEAAEDLWLSNISKCQTSSHSCGSGCTGTEYETTCVLPSGIQVESSYGSCNCPKPQREYCFPAGAYVFVNGIGTVNVSDLYKMAGSGMQLEIATVNENNGRVQFQIPKQVISHDAFEIGAETLFNITYRTASGDKTISATGNHPLAVVGSKNEVKYVETSNLEAGVRLFVGGGKPMKIISINTTPMASGGSVFDIKMGAGNHNFLVSSEPAKTLKDFKRKAVLAHNKY